MPFGAPAYRTVADAMRQRIRSGEYPVGEELPRVDDLAATESVSHMTIKRALDLLSDDGLLLRRQGKRAVVVAVPDAAEPSVGDQLEAIRARLTALEDKTHELDSHTPESTRKHSPG